MRLCIHCLMAMSKVRGNVGEFQSVVLSLYFILRKRVLPTLSILHALARRMETKPKEQSVGTSQPLLS